MTCSGACKKTRALAQECFEMWTAWKQEEKELEVLIQSRSNHQKQLQLVKRANPDLASSFPGLKDKICIKIVRRIMEITERMQAKLDGQEKKVEAVLEKQSACLESGVQALSEICGPSGCQVMWLYEWLTRATTLLHTHLLTLKTDLLTLCDKVEVDLHKLGIPVSRHLAQGISYINI